MVTKPYPSRRTDREMPAGEFKAKCLKVMDEVAQYRRTVTITKHGKPVAKLVPLDVADVEDDAQPSSIFGCLAGKVVIVGDIESPVVPWSDWEAYGASSDRDTST